MPQSINSDFILILLDDLCEMVRKLFFISHIVCFLLLLRLLLFSIFTHTKSVFSSQTIVVQSLIPRQQSFFNISPDNSWFFNTSQIKSIFLHPIFSRGTLFLFLSRLQLLLISHNTRASPPHIISVSLFSPDNRFCIILYRHVLFFSFPQKTFVLYLSSDTGCNYFSTDNCCFYFSPDNDLFIFSINLNFFWYREQLLTYISSSNAVFFSCSKNVLRCFINGLMPENKHLCNVTPKVSNQLI